MHGNSDHWGTIHQLQHYEPDAVVVEVTDALVACSAVLGPLTHAHLAVVALVVLNHVLACAAVHLLYLQARGT